MSNPLARGFFAPGLLARIAVVIASFALVASADNKPVFFYTDGNSAHLVAADGTECGSASLPKDAGDITASPDCQWVAYTRAPAGDIGGQIYLASIASGKSQRLTKGPYLGEEEEGSKEAYSDPVFSPEGGRIAFAVHPQAKGDVEDLAGPVAIVSLPSGTVNVLVPTLDIDGDGPPFANDLHWRPDGKALLINFEDGAGVADAGGHTVVDLSPKLQTFGYTWSHVLGWMSNSCIVYRAGKEQQDGERRPPRVLDTTTGRSAVGPKTLVWPDDPNAMLLAISPSVRVHAKGRELVAQTAAGTFAFKVQDISRVKVGIVPQPGDEPKDPTCVPPGATDDDQ